jgi:uncharacterized coiled-coil DUF342 family protein
VQATGNIARMQQELQFYQKQAVDAMQARDRANSEAEQLRSRNSKLDTEASTCQLSLKATQNSYAEAQQRLKDQEKEVSELKKRVEQAAQVPRLQLQTEVLQESLAQEQASRTQAEVGALILQCISKRYAYSACLVLMCWGISDCFWVIRALAHCPCCP